MSDKHFGSFHGMFVKIFNEIAIDYDCMKLIFILFKIHGNVGDIEGWGWVFWVVRSDRLVRISTTTVV